MHDDKYLKYARGLRKYATDVENKLWYYLRSEGFVRNNIKFRRQHIIEPYIVDFICISKKLIIELDGGQHAEQIEYDHERTMFLAAKGYKVIRFWNNEIVTNLEGVLETIFHELMKR